MGLPHELQTESLSDLDIMIITRLQVINMKVTSWKVNFSRVSSLTTLYQENYM
jgi:hypothetical protein